MKKGGILIAVVLFLTVTPVSSKSYPVGYPTSPDGLNDWPISLNLGASWYNTARQKWHRGHMGIDLVEAEGTRIYIAANGTIDKVLYWPKCHGYSKVCVNGECVLKPDDNHGWGPTVVIRHEYPAGYNTDGTYLSATPAEDNPTVVYTQYGHLDSVDHLEAGQEVEKGEYLGKIGQICGWIPHLHFEIKDTEAVERDRVTTAGAGFGYSGTDGHAPNRYIPQEFIAANQFQIVPESSKSKNTYSVFLQIKGLLGSAFDIVNLSRAAGDIQTREQVDVETSEEPEPAVYDANIVSGDTVEIEADIEEALLVVQAVNTGNTMWKKEDVSLNVVGGRTANDAYRHETWLTDLRPTRLDQTEVPPGGVATFTTLIQVPLDTSEVTFRSQIVRQEGGSFLQVGSSISSVLIRRITDESTIQPEQTTDEETPDDTSFFEQVESVVKDVVEDVVDSTTEVFEEVGEAVRSVFIWRGGGDGDDSESEEVDAAEEEIPLDVSISINSPTTSLYYVTTSSVSISGTFGTDVESLSVSTTASGTLVVATSTWSWDGIVDAGTTTIRFYAYGGEDVAQTELVVQYVPVYTLDSPVITVPTTSSIWYTNATRTIISGTVDSRVTRVLLSFETTTISVHVSSSTWHMSVIHPESQTYILHSEDEWGNSSETSTFTIVTDFVSPEIVTSSFILSSSSLRYTLVATDTTSGVERVNLQMRLASVGEVGACEASTSTVALVEELASSTCSWYTVSEETLYLPDAMHEASLIVRYRPYDVAGNIGDWEYKAVMYQENLVEEIFTPGAVVFSQIAWMGTAASANDEWIELYNQSGLDINMYGWKITWGTYTSSTDTYAHEIVFDIPPEIPIEVFPTDDEGVPLLPLPAQSFVTFERTSESTIDSQITGVIYTGALANDGEYLQLWNASGVLIDRVDMSGGWSAGDNSTKESMVRVDSSIDGSSAYNWCTFLSCPIDSLVGVAEQFDADGNLINGSPRMPALPDIGDPIEPEL